MGNVIKIVGTGPGHPDYITPKALQAIREAQVLIGARRLLRDYAQPGQECRAVGKDLNAVLDYILKQPRHKTIAVLVSGDPGFFSMARYLKSRLHWLDFEYIPGISSVQYMFAGCSSLAEVPFTACGRQGGLVKWKLPLLWWPC